MLSIGRRQLLAICGHIANLLAFTESWRALPKVFYQFHCSQIQLSPSGSVTHHLYQLFLTCPVQLFTRCWYNQKNSGGTSLGQDNVSGFTTRRILEAPVWVKTTSVRVYHICCGLSPPVVVGSSCLEDCAVHASRWWSEEIRLLLIHRWRFSGIDQVGALPVFRSGNPGIAWI